jgi:hypothetical protein
MGGTFDLVLILMVLDLVRSLLWERFGVGGVGTCTLLGPEGPGAGRVSLWAGVVGGCFLVGLVWCHRLVVLGEVPPVL